MTTTTHPSGSGLAAFALALAAAFAHTPAMATAYVSLGTPGGGVSASDPIGLSRDIAFNTGDFSGQANASAALDTGTLRAAVDLQANTVCVASSCSNASGKIVDSLTFYGPGPTVDVLFGMHVDGSFMMSGTTGQGEIQVDGVLTLDEYGSANLSLDRLYIVGYGAQDSLTGSFTGAPGSFLNKTLNSADGMIFLALTVPTNYTLLFTGLLAVNDRYAQSDVHAVADFYNTAQVSMSLPTGYTYTSASGVFLSASPVPEPTRAPMFAVGLGLLGLARHRRSRVTPTP